MIVIELQALVTCAEVKRDHMLIPSNIVEPPS